MINGFTSQMYVLIIKKKHKFCVNLCDIIFLNFSIFSPNQLNFRVNHPMMS
jgi:hypothetical protein